MSFSRWLLIGFILLLSLPKATQCAVPTIYAGGVVNSADYGPVISSGSIVAIYGANLAANTVVATEKPLPTSLDGVSVLVAAGGQELPAALFFVSAGQINAQLPYGLGGQQVTIRVRTSAGTSNAIQIALQAFSPRFFTKTADGQGEALLVHYPSYELVSEAWPAEPEEVVILYVSGLGEVTPAITAGMPAGDNATLGPLNSVMHPVEVRIGGQQTAFLWAGLAPGFAGLYQVNLIMPATLPTGMAEITVLCGGGQTQANVKVATTAKAVEKLAPEEVVKRALEAQVQGDIDGLMSYFALDRFSEAAIADGQSAFTLFRNNVGLSEFVFTHVATGFGDLGDMAIVRAEVAYRMTAPGVNRIVTAGVIVTLVGGEGSWKIFSINPDDLLNAEIYERENESAGSSGSALSRRYTRAITLHEINALLNEAMTHRNMDELDMAKLTADGANVFIGRFPGIGDAIAQVYQVANVGYNLYQGGRELFTRGFTPIFVLEMTQTAVGVGQIATELVPGVDTAADEVGMYVENVTKNAEMQRAIQEYQSVLSHPKQGYDAHLFLLAGEQYQYPQGMKVSEDPDVETLHGRPPQGISLTSPESIGAEIPFQVIAEFPLPSDLGGFAEQFGAQQIAGEWRVPVDITMIAGWDDFTQYATGDRILQNPKVIRSTKGTSTAISWTVTCVRGSQPLAVKLHNGEAVIGPKIVNKYMNEMATLRVTEIEDGKIPVGVNESKSIQIYGVPSVGGVPEIDLTPRYECLDVFPDGIEIFGMTRGQKIEIKGNAEGTAPLHLRLNGATYENTNVVTDIVMDVPVVVGEEGSQTWEKSVSGLFYNSQWNISYTATVSTSGSLVGCQEQAAGTFAVLSCFIPAAESDPPAVDTYTITLTAGGISPVNANAVPQGEDWEQKVYLGFTEAGMVETSSVMKTLPVPRGRGEYIESVSVIVYYYNKKTKEERWVAGGTLFRFYLRNP